MHSAILYFIFGAKRTRGMARHLPVKKNLIFKITFKIWCKILGKVIGNSRAEVLFEAAKQRVRLHNDLQWSDDANPSMWHQSQAGSTGSLGITLCLPRLQPHLLWVGHEQQPLPGTDPCETNAHRSQILFAASTFPFACCSGARQKGWRKMLTSELGAGYQLWNTQRCVG